MNSRIIIDTYAWNRFQPSNSVSVSTFGRGNTSSNVRNSSEDEEYYDEWSSNFSGEESEIGDADETIEVISEAKKPRARPLTQDQLLLCTATLEGYSLKDKKWRKRPCGYHFTS